METLLTERTNLNDIYSEVNHQQNHCEDIILHAKEITLIDEDTVKVNGTYYKIDHWAMTQLCARLEIPYTYFVKCMKNCVGLAHETFLTWSNINNKKTLLRLYHGRIIGVLSSRYSTFDNTDVMKILTSVDRLNDMEIRNHLVTPSRFHIRMTTDKPFMQDLYTGIQIDNSQVGKSPFSVYFMVYKQICTNGLIANLNDSKVFVKRHVGDLKDSTQHISERLNQLTEYTKTMKDSITETISSKLTYLDAVSIMDKLVDNKVFTRKYVADLDIIGYLNQYGFNKWGFINALTEISQDFPLSKRIEIETLAGRMLA